MSAEGYYRYLLAKSPACQGHGLVGTTWIIATARPGERLHIGASACSVERDAIRTALGATHSRFTHVRVDKLLSEPTLHVPDIQCHAR